MEDVKLIKVLLGITTTFGSDWEAKIKELKKLRLQEVAIFLTCLNKAQRMEFYRLIGETGIREIPFVHARGDMEPWELDYLITNYKTQAFTLHTIREYPRFYDYKNFKDKIFIENVYHVFDEKEINNFGGICLDISHMENDRLSRKENFKANEKFLEKVKIGCNHVSAIKNLSFKDSRGFATFSCHMLKNKLEMDYLKNYPLKYFSSIVALELENSIKEQLKIRDYVLKIIKNLN